MSATSLKVELPAELRQRIEAWMADLDARMAAAESACTEARKNLEALQSQEGEIDSQVAAIQQRGSQASDEELSVLPLRESRLRLVREEIESAQAACETAEAVEVELNARGILREVREFYCENLPDIIARHNAPLFRSLTEARQSISPDCFAAWNSLFSFQTFIAWLQPNATQSIRNEIFAIVGRALRGEPAIYFDGATTGNPPQTT